MHLVDLDKFKNLDPHWISGFVAGDLSFEVNIKLRNSKYEIGLTLSLSQHIRDVHLFICNANYFGYGNVYNSSTDLNCYLKNTKIFYQWVDFYNKIIPLTSIRLFV